MMAKSIRFFVAVVAQVYAQELVTPQELLASQGKHELTIAEVPFHDGYTDVFTRGFNGGIPGPTFRLSPGETLEVTMINNLDPAHSMSCAELNTEFCETSISNMHTHGLHVSSKGLEDGLAAQSDNIFAVVEPETTEEFAFTIPDDHMGGTFWYHPHHHHATALQAGGGALGMMIVDDPPGYLPAPYDTMVEKVLVISAHNLNTLQTMARASQSTLLENAADQADELELDTNVFLVNGQLDPTIPMDSHRWYRFRMVFAAV